MEETALKQNSGKKNNKYLSFFFVIVSHILMFGTAVLTSFLLPKFFSITSYGYIKTYTLYFTYLGLAHFGFIDGLHILLSNKKYEDLDKKHIRAYSLVFTIFELLLSAIAFIIALIVFSGENKVVFTFIALSIFAYNFSGYGQQLAIVSSRFKLVSISNFVDVAIRLLTILLIWVLFKFIDVPIYFYFILYILQYLVTGAIYCIASKDCFFGKSDIKQTSYKEYFGIIKVGIPLMIANLLVSLVSSFTSLFIQLAYPLEQSDAYSIFSFAISMSSIVNPIVTAVGVVFFPSIRKMDENKAFGLFRKMYLLFSVLIGVALIFYPVLIKIFAIIVPKYETAFPLYKFLFPAVLINSIVICVNLNYFKLIRKINMFSILSIGSVALMAIVAFPLYFTVLKNIDTFSALQVFSIINLVGHIIWLIVTSLYLEFKLKIYNWESLLFILLCIGIFIAISFVDLLTMIGFLLFYGLCLLILIPLFYFNETKQTVILVKKYVLTFYNKIKR